MVQKPGYHHVLLLLLQMGCNAVVAPEAFVGIGELAAEECHGWGGGARLQGEFQGGSRKGRSQEGRDLGYTNA